MGSEQMPVICTVKIKCGGSVDVLEKYKLKCFWRIKKVLDM